MGGRPTRGRRQIWGMWIRRVLGSSGEGGWTDWRTYHQEVVLDSPNEGYHRLGIGVARDRVDIESTSMGLNGEWD